MVGASLVLDVASKAQHSNPPPNPPSEDHGSVNRTTACPAMPYSNQDSGIRTRDSLNPTLRFGFASRGDTEDCDIARSRGCSRSRTARRTLGPPRIACGIHRPDRRCYVDGGKTKAGAAHQDRHDADMVRGSSTIRSGPASLRAAFRRCLPIEQDLEGRAQAERALTAVTIPSSRDAYRISGRSSRRPARCVARVRACATYLVTSSGLPPTV
jgi:hypothetical protein